MLGQAGEERGCARVTETHARTMSTVTSPTEPEAALKAEKTASQERLAWWRRGSLADRICLGGIALNAVIGMTTSFMVAYLLARPLWNLALRGSIAAIVSAGALASVGRLEVAAALACAYVGVMGFDMLYWWAGKRYEHRMASDLRKLSGLPERRIAQAEMIMGRHGFWILVVRYFQPVPNAVLQLLAGAGQMPVWKFLTASLLGATLWIGVLGTAGWLAGEAAVAVIDTITDNALKVTIGIVVAAVAWNSFKTSREVKRGRGAGLSAETVAETERQAQDGPVAES